MKAQSLSGTRSIDAIPVQKLLEGLARLYQLVLVLDADARVVWLSNEMGALCSADPRHVGHDARTIFPESTAFRSEFAVRSQLRKRGFLSNMECHVRDNRGELIPIELSILPIDMETDEKPLYVAVARPVENEEPVLGESQPAAKLLAAIVEGAP